MKTINALMLNRVGPHLFIEAAMRALCEQQIVDRSQHGGEAVGIGEPPLTARLAARVITQRLRFAAQIAFEQALVGDEFQRAQRRSIKRIGVQSMSAGRPGAGKQPLGAGMGPQQ